MLKKLINFTFLLSFIFISGCGVTDYVTGVDDSEPELTSEIDLELTSDDDKAIKEMIENQKKIDNDNSINEDNSVTISDSSEKLDPSPTKEYDSVLIEPEINNDSEDKIIDPQDEIIDSQDDIIKVEEKKSITLPEFQKLKLSDKIQYRIATINFQSGSSNVSFKGQRKIKKIVDIAKRRDAKIKIVGHASKRTKDMPLDKHKLVNFNISYKRAQSVAKLVIEKFSFPSSNLVTEAVSDSKPLFREDMPAGTKANQRTEIFIIY
ncbi:MAG: OmpA family protein [Alphaproteobacteria bacterium]